MAYCLLVRSVLGPAPSSHSAALGPAGAPALSDLHSACAPVVARFVNCCFWHQDTRAETTGQKPEKALMLSLKSHKKPFANS